MDMTRKIRVGCVTLIAMAAVGAAFASVAAAGEWLVNGAALAVVLASETEGRIELYYYSGATVLNRVRCEVILDGIIGPNGSRSIEDMLTLTQALVEELALSTTKFADCTVVASAGGLGDCINGTLAKVFPKNLNLNTGLIWTLLFELMMGGPNLTIYPPSMGFETICETTLGEVEDSCEGSEESDEMTNEVEGDVLEELGEVGEAERENCSTTGKQSSSFGVNFRTWALGELELERLTTAIS